MKVKQISRIVLCAVVIFALAAIAALFVPIPPHGRFSTPQIANTADAYFEAREGVFTQVVFDGERAREGRELRHVMGSYHKQGGRWILSTPQGYTSELRATLISLTIVDSKTRPARPFYRYEIYKGR